MGCCTACQVRLARPDRAASVGPPECVFLWRLSRIVRTIFGTSVSDSPDTCGTQCARSGHPVTGSLFRFDSMRRIPGSSMDAGGPSRSEGGATPGTLARGRSVMTTLLRLRGGPPYDSTTSPVAAFGGKWPRMFAEASRSLQSLRAFPRSSAAPFFESSKRHRVTQLNRPADSRNGYCAAYNFCTTCSAWETSHSGRV